MKYSCVLAETAVWVSLLAATGVAYAQDSAQDCVVSKNGVCLDATLGNSPSEIVAPKPVPVIFKDGRLSITSENSSLRDILTAVGSATGVEIELPPGGLEERVVTHLGPGPMRDVLVELLNGSSFNYVMLASPGNPAVLQRLVMTSRTEMPGTLTASIPQPPPSEQASGPALYGQGFSAESNDSSEAEAPQPARDAEWASKQGHLLDQMQKQRIKEEEDKQQQQANPPPQ